MHTNTNIGSSSHRLRTVRNARPSIAQHRLPACGMTGLPRYRDRHQARQASRAFTVNGAVEAYGPYRCEHCSGYHLEGLSRAHSARCTCATCVREIEPMNAGTARRLILVDIENLTLGADATAGDVARIWSHVAGRVIRVGASDRVVIGASFSVARQYRSCITNHNVRWVLGGRERDAADRALLADVDRRRLARDFEELVVVSGDHAFAGLASEAASAGLRVVVIVPQRQLGRSVLARELAAAADDILTVWHPAKEGDVLARRRAARLDAVRRVHHAVAA